MTVALASGYAITFSEEARASFWARQAEHYGPDPAAVAGTGASLAKLAARHPDAVTRKVN